MAVISTESSTHAKDRRLSKTAATKVPKVTVNWRVEDYVRPRVSPIRVLFTSATSAGSWEIRGRQIAGCRTNWKATHDVSTADLKDFDICCVVKRADPWLVDEVRRRKKLLVLDIVDSWAQPDDGLDCPNVAAARVLFSKQWKPLGASAFIFPNMRMKRDLRPIVPYGAHLYHHYYPPLTPIEIRPRPITIGYEGNEKYLGEWHDVLSDICRRRGMKLAVNPQSLTELDIGVAFRGGQHDSFLSNSYKSNVKLANFYGAGIPCIVTSKDVSYHETDQGDVRYAKTPEQLDRQIEELMNPELRQRIQSQFLLARANYRLEVMADCYERFFLEVVRNHQLRNLKRWE